jgi:hypothetical protein
MAERWERELGRLGTLTVPLSTLSRFAEGPRGEGMPPRPRRGQRVAAGVVAFAVFGAAAALAIGAFRSPGTTAAASPDPTTAVVIHLSSSGGPKASLEYRDHAADPQTGSYCWSQGDSEMCADTVLTPFAVADFVPVPQGSLITVDGDSALEHADLFIAPGNDPGKAYTGTKPSTATTTVVGDPGDHLLIASASWPQGTVGFYFPIEIVSPAPSSSPPSSGGELLATLDAPTDGSMPHLTLTCGGISATIDAQDGRWPGTNLARLPLFSFNPRIDPGATVLLDSDAKNVEGSLWIANQDQSLTGESIALDLSSGSATLPDGPGLYRLTVAGTWPEGEAGFSVGITIGTPPSYWPPAPPIATVPDVVGLTQHEAVARLTAAGFVSVSVATPAGQSGGSVTSQDPAAGTQTQTTTTVKLTVSTTP